MAEFVSDAPDFPAAVSEAPALRRLAPAFQSRGNRLVLE